MSGAQQPKRQGVRELQNMHKEGLKGALPFTEAHLLKVATLIFLSCRPR